LGQPVKEAVPSTPVEILGFNTAPTVGSEISDQFHSQPLPTTNNQPPTTKKAFNLESILASQKKEKTLKVIIKTDSFGSLEAIKSSLSQKEDIEIVLAMVGDINKSDIFLAKTTKAIVIGFNTKISQEIKDLAKQEKVIIKTYNIIFELLEELDEVTDLIRLKEETEKDAKGEAKILATFIIEKEKIFGVRVNKGKINLGDQIKLYRNNNPIGKTKVVSLKIRAKVVDEVKKDQEAGIIFSPVIDIKIGDVVKSIL